MSEVTLVSPTSLKHDAADKVEFHAFAKAVRKRYDTMSKGELYVTDVDRDELWSTYLAAFPEGSNPIFRVRTDHDCSCCRNFIRNIGALVEVRAGKLVSVWDIEPVGYPYDIVAKTMARFAMSAPIKNVFRSKQTQFGNATTRELVDGATWTWHHFEAPVNASHRVAAGPSEYLGEMDATHQVLTRGLAEITPEAVETVLDLISQGDLYRGDEFAASVRAFQTMQEELRHSSFDLHTFGWANIRATGARIRNTVIGTLLTDLSTHADIERAVSAYESKVAPQNYQRPTALITPAMVTKALEKLDELDLRSAVERRHARIDDVSVTDVLFVDNSVQPLMRDALADALMSETKTPATVTAAASDISATDFFAQVLPLAASIDVYLEQKHHGNFMSVTAPVHADAGNLFAWENNFAWTYDGDNADSIKQRVKRAGGDIDARMRVSLAWTNHDDLDIHVIEPNGTHIYYGSRYGKLDVDMNVVDLTRTPVENVSWKSPSDGEYLVYVHNYTQRESHDVGFSLEVEIDGNVTNYVHESAVRNHNRVDAIQIVMNNGSLQTIKTVTPNLVKGHSASEKWGLTSGDFVPLDTLITSPNHWNGKQVGNKHWFFLLRGCRNPHSVRGIYNEFLTSDLKKHRKVFEVLGSKTKCPPSDAQLSGIGFSSTQRAELTVRVKNASINRTYNIQF